jgi:acyl-CoA synthetase (NDP forming)
LHCLHSVADLPAGVDLAILAVPAAAVPAVAADCGRNGVRALIVITAGLGSAGADLLAVCRRYGMRLVGPNCFGISLPGLRLNATFAAHAPAAGSAGLVVQSGGVGIALLEHLSRLGIGVSSFASVGDKFDVSSNDLLTWWERDQQTRHAVLYVESFGNPRAFARTARRLGRQMPVLTVISGRSAAGQRAAASHTAAAATPVVTQEALFGQAGIIAAHSIGEVIEAAALLSCQPTPSGRRVAIVSNAGGAGVLAADACADSGLEVVTLSSATQRKLVRLLPPGAAVANPVDTSAAVGQDAFSACLREVAADNAVDALLVITVPTAIADLTGATLTAEVTKPLAVAILDQADAVRLVRTPAASETAAVAEEAALSAGSTSCIPAYAYPESAARALARAAHYGAWRARQRSPLPSLPGLDVGCARALIAAFLQAEPHGGWLPAPDAAQLLGCYQIPLVTTTAVVSAEAAVAAATEIGGRVVLKADAAGIVHKTEAGAVRLNLRPEEVAAAYRELASQFGADLRRVLVQPMLTGGVEVLVGVVQEPVFGPLVVFGLGGVATEVLGDHAARLTPLTSADAEDLIHGVHAAPLLFGHRGSPAVDTAALTGLLLRVSKLADDFAEIAELDLNPVLARPDGVSAVDVRIKVAPASPYDPYLRRLR